MGDFQFLSSLIVGLQDPFSLNRLINDKNRQTFEYYMKLNCFDP